MHRPHRRKSVKIVRFRFRVEKPHTAHSQIANAALTLIVIHRGYTAGGVILEKNGLAVDI